MYFTYDIKGIQSQILAVPRLKIIVGTSSHIDYFDRETIIAIASKHDARLIFAGGGRGVLEADPLVIDPLQTDVVTGVHRLGLSVRTSVADQLYDACTSDQILHPFLPETLEGPPCRMTGMYPVPGGGVHPIITSRLQEAREDRIGTRLLKHIQEFDLLPDSLKGRDLVFFRSVSPDDDTDIRSKSASKAGLAAIGGRERWAVICMDGNDIGSQHRRALEIHDESSLIAWFQGASQALDQLTLDAVAHGIGVLLNDWVNDSEKIIEKATTQDGEIILPFRPLILGGDDVVCLCSTRYALKLVRVIAEQFETQAAQRAEQWRKDHGGSELWPATGGRLTISAGITFAKASFPIHSLVTYTESLLASAKGKGRNQELVKPDQPSPAAVDWDHLTESLVTHPATRRQSEMMFHDEDMNKQVVLTQRPYVLGEPFDRLLEIVDNMTEQWRLPGTIQAALLQLLMRPRWQRVRGLAAMGKRHPGVAAFLDEKNEHPGPGWQDINGTRTTRFVDALLLIQEQQRS